MNTPAAPATEAATEAPYRIATDSRPEWKVRARTHGPIRPRTLTVKTQSGTAPTVTPEDAHRSAAEQLARKINPAARVELYSAGPYGNAYDWRVMLPTAGTIAG